MAKVGFIGLGNMGGPMAVNIAQSDHEVIGFDLLESNVSRVVDKGVSAAEEVSEAVLDSYAVVTCLPAGKHIRELYLGEAGILAMAAPGTVFIDASTVDIEASRAVHEEAETRGQHYVDAPMSGGVGGAQAGTLTFMVGGLEESFERAEPFLKTMGKTIVHAGGPGAGTAAKICNNMILGISMIGVCEAFVLAEKLGLSHQKLFDISSTASGRCWSLDTYCPVPGPVSASPANFNYKAGFTTAMMLKDLRLSQAAAETAGTQTDLGALATELYTKFDEGGDSGTDFSGIIRMIRGGE